VKKPQRRPQGHRLTPKEREQLGRRAAKLSETMGIQRVADAIGVSYETAHNLIIEYDGVIRGLTGEERARRNRLIVKLGREGRTIGNIANTLDLPYHVVRDVLINARLWTPSKRPRIRGERRERLGKRAAKLSEKMTIREVAQKLEVSFGTARTLIIENNGVIREHGAHLNSRKKAKK
jgi:hypothetical protein